MSAGRNPFADQATGASRGTSAKIGWTLAALMASAAGAGWFSWKSAVDQVQRLESVRLDLSEAKTRLTNTLGDFQQQKDEIASLRGKVAALEHEKEAAGQAAKQLEDQMRADLESRDVTISKLQGKLTVNILDRVMFDSGEAILKPGGESVLQKIAGLLAEHSELKIHVIGHTDNVPIRNRFPSNWELSTARALAAVHFLTEKAGVAPDRVGAVGYGEHRPIADNATGEGRAKNRRIAITILPDELAKPEQPPAPAGVTTAEQSAP